MRSRLVGIAAATLVAIWSDAAPAQPVPSAVPDPAPAPIQGARPSPRAAPWPGTFLGRLEALALVQTLNATLLAARSATFTLEAWCGDHGLAAEPRVRALLSRDVDKPASPEQRARLQVSADEPVRYRRVRLACGDHVLSEADNWYVPGRLTPEMNRLLETTDTAFGRAVQDLHPFRQTFAVDVLWSPLPKGWERATLDASDTEGPLAIPDRLFEHRALLFGPDRRPFSEVTESYTREVLAFGPPAR